MQIIPIKKVIFPYTRDVLDIETREQINVLKGAFEAGEKVILTPQELVFGAECVGTVIKVEQLLSPFSDVAKILYSAYIQVSFVVGEECAEGVYSTDAIEPIVCKNKDNTEVLALEKMLKDSFAEYIELASSTAQLAEMDGDLEHNINVIAAVVNCRQLKIYLERDLVKKLSMLCADLQSQIEIVKMESVIEEKVKDAAEQNQKEFYIREQIHALSEELGEEDDNEFYLKKIAEAQFSTELKEKLERDVYRMRNMSVGSPELAIIKNYLDVIFELPWNVFTEDNEDLSRARTILDQDHYGMKKVKERLIEALAVRLLTKNSKSPILCLVGPAGVGKTSVARSIANAMNKKYVRVSFGGIRDEAEIRGHRKTYVGSMPGRIITGISTAGSMNPVFLMDEIDKMSSDYKGDPASALLEVLDPEQNNNFRDHYLEIPFDLSKVLFITTANSLDTISRPLLDRMEIIEMSGYTFEEKIQIAKRHLLKKVMEENGIKQEWVRFTDRALEEIIYRYTKESGVRGLSKQLSKVMRKIATIFVEQPQHKAVHISEKNIKEYLGKPIYGDMLREKEDVVGSANGLAWTEVGGETLPVEVAAMLGKGDIILTGSLGDVMKESARIGLTYLRSAGFTANLTDDYFKTHDIHVHVPEGATPKDGPSAGITMATAMVSLFQNTPVRADTAMTGEITLHGKVLPIGGLKEKTLAAMRSGAKRVIIPEENRKDYEELPESVKKNMEFFFVNHAAEVFCLALKGSNQ